MEPMIRGYEQALLRVKTAVSVRHYRVFLI